jgi:hypothetical protein
MNTLFTAATAALFALSTGAMAATIQPTSSDGRTGDDAATGARGAAELAYDGNDVSFYELNYGETVNFFFDGEFKSPGSVLEITNVVRAEWDEYIEVRVGIEGDESSFELVDQGIISNLTAGEQVFTFTPDTAFNALRITDVTLANADFSIYSQEERRAGFDLSEVSVTAVPLPAGALLLLTGVGAIALRRKKTA